MTKQNSARNSARRKLRTRTSAYLIIRQLSGEMYERDACLNEIYRNCVNASMPPGEYDPSLVHIEIMLDEQHPLSPGAPALQVLDHGRGFTDADFDNLETLGPSKNHGVRYLYGGSQKCIGRLAGMNLVRAIHDDEDVKSGYYILTRTSARGPIKFLHYTPIGIEEESLEVVEMDPDCSELGRYKNIKGSFTLIVIPDTVYKSVDQVREDLKWRLPRTKDMAMDIKVQGQPCKAPPLEKHYKAAGEITAYLGRPKSGDPDTGVWLVDAATGFRCACAADMNKFMPYPLASRDLKGDILIPGLLNKQNTNRSGLSPKFLNSAEWRKIKDTLLLHFCEFANDILGNDDVFNPDDPLESGLMDIVDLFDARFGVPEINGGDLPGVVAGGRKLPEGKPKPKGKPRQPTKRLHARRPKHPSADKLCGRAFNIDGEPYILRRSPSLGELVMYLVETPRVAQEDGRRLVDLNAPKELRFNPLYKLKLGSPAQDQEHRLWRMLTAVYSAKTENHAEVENLAAKLRLELGKLSRKRAS